MNNSHDKLTDFNGNNIIHHIPENKQKIVIPNTGATGNYLQDDALHLPSKNMGPPSNVVFPNGQTIQSHNPCLLYFSVLPEEACEGNTTPSIKHSSLVSIGNIYYAGCISEFKSQEVTINRKVEIIIQAPREKKNGLREIPLTARLRVSPKQTQREKPIKHTKIHH